jgi:hypothetical protein
MRKLLILFLCFTFCTVETIESDNITESSNDAVPRVTYTNCPSEPVAKTNYELEIELRAGSSDIIELSINTYKSNDLFSSAVYDRATYEEYGMFPNAKKAVRFDEAISSKGFITAEFTSEVVIDDRDGTRATGTCTIIFSQEVQRSEKHEYEYDRINLESEPFEGTNYDLSDFVNETDYSSFSTIEFIETGSRQMLTRESDTYELLEAHVFTAYYLDDHQISIEVNTEFNFEEAQDQAKKYAYMFGQLPKILKSRVNSLHIHKGYYAWAGDRYNNTIVIHTDVSDYLENLPTGSFLEESLIHEATHITLDHYYLNSPLWKEAQQNDNAFVSEYAKEFPNQEDITESFVAYVAVKHFPDRLDQLLINKVLSTSINRFKFFDNESFDMSIYDKRVFDLGFLSLQDYQYEKVELESPPYDGTIFVSGDIITEDDPSTLDTFEYIGQELRAHYDRRDDQYIDRELFIFHATFTDILHFLSLEVYSSDFTEEEAYNEAQKYSYLFGQLPAVLKKDVRNLVINSDDDAWSASWISGVGDGYIFIRTGMSSIYENEIFGSILEETLIHEAAHISLDTEIYQMSAWKQAVINDGQYISTYAQDYEGENISELMPFYIAVKYFPERISEEIYNNVLSTSLNRVQFLDSLRLDFSIYEK